MKTPILFAAFTLAATAAYAADATFDRSLSVGAAPTVSISNGSGYVHVSAGQGNQVHITGHVHAHPGWLRSSGDIDQRVKQIAANPPITQTGDIVTINRHESSDLFDNVSIDYDVILPHTASLTARIGSGDLQIVGVDNLTSASSGSGSIHVDNAGANVHLSAGSGSIDASHLGPHVEIRTGSGSIHALDVHGAATLETGSGSQELSLSAPGDVTSRSSSGGVRISGVSGALRASAGSGTIEVTGNPTSDWRLQTGSGGVHLATDASAHFTLEADTGSGGVKVNRPVVMQGSLNRHHVSGTVNGGGPTVRVTTGSGSVTVR
jgi:DUF4097 and DUF4098 domain-containing protein YvlB